MQSCILYEEREYLRNTVSFCEILSEFLYSRIAMDIVLFTDKVTCSESHQSAQSERSSGDW